MRHTAIAQLLVFAFLGPAACDSAESGDNKSSAAPAGDKAKSDDKKPDAKSDAKKADAKSDDKKADAKADAKADEAKADDAKADDAKADEAKADEAKADEAKADEAKAEPEPAGDAGAPLPNATVFIVRDKGAVVLTDDGFSTLPGSASVSMRKFAKGADGTLYALTSKAIFALRAGKLERMADISYDTLGTVSVFDVDSNGVFWAAGSKGVHHHEKGAWVTETLADVGLPDTHFTGLAIDGDNLPWLSTSKDLAHRLEGGWAPVELSGKKKLRYFRSMGRGPDGAVFLSAMDKLYQLNPTPAVIKVKKPRYSSLGDVAFSQAGVGAIKTGTDSVAVFLPKDKVATYGKKDFNVGMISSVAVDDQARVWVAGDGGVVILGPDDLRVTWRSGAIEEVAGKVTQIMTVGLGPKLPEAGERKKGGLKGKIIKDGAGVASTKVELCEAPSMFPKKTPCTGAPTHLQGETDAEGNFEFKDVPLGAYGIAVKSGKKWQVTLGAALGSKMVEGETFDIGSVELKDK